MISGKSKPNFWSRLLFSMIAIFALPNAQSLENQSTPNHSSQVAIQQALETVKVAQKAQSHRFQSSSILHSAEKRFEIQPHFVANVLNLQAPIRAGPVRI
ncbi:secA translation cis-regulator SecM [Rodentibacter myodis]|uniref:DUF2547 domain-containing protein n=1 Tax=Rodentibacter myodis TaxID=1907939 RepID=A0A1V3JRV2_9PAST|nr:hypothetical protein BKL49_03430 [Rodentibacter myodis]